MPKISIGRAELENRPHILYRFYDRTGVLLYIGITVDFADRMATHAKEKDWWARVDRSATKVQYLDTRRAALDAERAAIKAEKPLENDQHNEWVDVETDLDEEYDVTGWILSAVDEAELKSVMADCAYGEGGRELPAEEQIRSAAYCLAVTWSVDRLQFVKMIDRLYAALKAAGNEDWTPWFRPMRDEAAKRPYINAYDRSIVLLESVIASFASHALSSLPEAEAEGWRECAVQVGERLPHLIEERAATYASNFKKYGRVPDGMCHGASWRGSRCSRRAEDEVFFEVCPECQIGECVGHRRWCHKHEAAAFYGRLEMLAGDPWSAYPLVDSRRQVGDAA